jgi:hypothetical protein
VPRVPDVDWGEVNTLWGDENVEWGNVGVDPRPKEAAQAWDNLGTCSCLRCCCCPATVSYPPTASVTWHQYVRPPNEDQSGDASATLSCTWLDCPRGTAHGGCGGDDGGIDFDPSVCCDGGTEVSMVTRCHACVYTLIGPDGTPGIKLEYDPDTGGRKIPAGTARVFDRYDDRPGDHFGEPIYKYLIGFGLFCACGGDLTFPGIPTYVNPDTGEACGWEGLLTYATGWADLKVADYVPGSDPPAPAVFTLPLNLGSVIGDGTGTYPNPPYRINAPLDPWLATCCPLRARFLYVDDFLANYDPEYWCDSPEATAWPDASEWPPHPGEAFPWNFPVPWCAAYAAGGGCGYVATGTACDCTPGGAAWDCQEDPFPGFSYVEVTAGAACFGGDADNCLNANLPDDNPNAC